MRRGLLSGGWLAVIVIGIGIGTGIGTGLAGRAWAASPRFLSPVVSPAGIDLRIQGDDGATCRVEGSTNLTAWFPVGSGVFQGGVLALTHSGTAAAPWSYYRAVLEGARPSYPTVGPELDASWGASAVVVPERESVLRFVGAGGVVYTLALPTRSVSEPTLVSLTAVTNLTGLPTRGGLLGAVRMEPEGRLLLAPVFLQIDFPTNLVAREVASFAFDNRGSGLHLVPDVVVSSPSTNRVRILVRQLRSHGSARFTLDEVRALAATVPPPRSPAVRAALHADMAGCYPEDEEAAREMQEELEDLHRPLEQAAAASLAVARQEALLGVADESSGTTALIQALEVDTRFYETEVRTRIPAAEQKCAVAQALVPWVLGYQRERQLLGGGISAGEEADGQRLLCSGLKRCGEQAMDSCRTQGGDTRLIQTVLGVERQRALLGAGPECGAEVSVEDVLKNCAPDWFGTVTVRISGRYFNQVTNGAFTVVRTSEEDMVLTASVLSARVKRNAASIFAPAYTNLTCVLGGNIQGATRMEKSEENRSERCDGLPAELRRDVWQTQGATNLSDISLEALILAPGSGGLFVKPYLRLSAEGPRDMRWTWVEERSYPSEFDDESCQTESRGGGTYETESSGFSGAFMANEGEFEYSADRIRYHFRGPEPMRFDFEHLFDGIREVDLELNRVR